MTTNVGNNPIYIGQASGANLVTIPGTTGSLMLYQDNPGAPLYFGPAGDLTIRQGTAGGTSAGVVKMGAGTVDIQCAATYAGGTRIYEGTLQTEGVGSAGTGAVNVYGGNYELSGNSTAAGATTVYSGATNIIYSHAANAQSAASSNLTFNAGSTVEFLYSNSITPNTTTAPLAITNANDLTLNSPVNVNVACGGLSVGQFPLVSYAGTVGGAGFAALTSLTLPPHIYGYLSNNTANSSFDLVVTNVDQPLTWNTGNGTWDIGVTSDWLDALNNSTTYQQVGSLGDNVVFSDSAPGPSITVTLNTNPTPSSVIINNSVNTYTISGTGGIGGLGSLTKTGSFSLTLGTVNSFSGGINLNGGAVIFNALGELGSAGINFNGGVLQYNGNTDDISTRTVTLASGGGTINTAGQSVTYSNTIAGGSVGGLTKAGTGTLTLEGTNTYHGNTVVSQGTLALGPNTYLTNSAAIIINGGAVLDTTTSGVNLNLSTLSSQILAGTGQVNGTVAVSPSTTISPATNGVVGTLAINGGLTMNGGTNVMDVSSSSSDKISVTGNLTLTSGTVLLNVTGSMPYGRYPLITYTGSLSGSAINLILVGFSQSGAIGTLDSSVPNQIALVVAVGANDNLTWAGPATDWSLAGSLNWLNGSTPWAYTNGDKVTFNDSNTGETTVELAGDLIPTMVTVSNTLIPTYTFANNGGAIEGGSLVKDGTGSLIMTTPNLYGGTTTILNGTLQIGNGGTTVGDIGQGNITNNGALIFAQGDGASHLVNGAISGTGSLTENATATVILTKNNTYSGPTTISNGTLQVGNGGATGSLGSNLSITNDGALTLDLSGASIFADNVTGSGSFGSVGTSTVSLTGTLTYQGSTEISNGVVKITANNQLPSTNTVAGSTGILNVDGGLATSSVLDMNGFNVTANGLSGAASTFVGIITNSSTTTTTTNVLTLLNLQSATNTYNGQINDHGATGAKIKLFVTGQAGTLILNPATNNLFSGGLVISNSTVWIGAPGSATTANITESTLAPGTGLITLLGTNTSLYENGGQTGASTTPTYNPETNNLSIPASQNVTIYGPCRGDIDGTLTGSGVLNFDTTYVRGGVNGNWSGFTGTMILSGNTSGGNVGFGATNGLPNTAVIFNTNVDFHAGSLTGFTPATWPTNASGAPVPFQIGSLSGGDSSSEIQGTSSGNAEGVNIPFAIGGLNTSTTYGGGIVDGVSLIKVGTGTLTLNEGGVTTTNVVNEGLFDVTNVGLQTELVLYTGSTTVSNGVLALDAPVNLNSNSMVTIAAPNAVLDASSMGYVSNIIEEDGSTNSVLITNSIFEVVSNQTLAGIGTLNGFLVSDQYSTNKFGLPTGTFNVTSNATLVGVVLMNLDNTDSPVCSELASPSITINPTATLLVTNIGPGLTNGATFTLFNQAVSGFASVTLPATDPTGTTNYMWQNNLAVNGSITLTNGGLVIVSINLNPTNIMFSATANPGSLTLSWPADHTGWTLQAQTNAPSAGISTNPASWFNVPGSTGTNLIIVPLNPTNSVFYRMFDSQ